MSTIKLNNEFYEIDEGGANDKLMAYIDSNSIGLARAIVLSSGKKIDEPESVDFDMDIMLANVGSGGGSGASTMVKVIKSDITDKIKDITDVKNQETREKQLDILLTENGISADKIKSEITFDIDLISLNIDREVKSKNDLKSMGKLQQLFLVHVAKLYPQETTGLTAKEHCAILGNYLMIYGGSKNEGSWNIDGISYNPIALFPKGFNFKILFRMVGYSLYKKIAKKDIRTWLDNYHDVPGVHVAPGMEYYSTDPYILAVYLLATMAHRGLNSRDNRLDGKSIRGILTSISAVLFARQINSTEVLDNYETLTKWDIISGGGRALSNQFADRIIKHAVNPDSTKGYF